MVYPKDIKWLNPLISVNIWVES